jgi:hypothetical protein
VLAALGLAALQRLLRIVRSSIRLIRPAASWVAVPPAG